MNIVFISFFKKNYPYSLQQEIDRIKPYYIILETLAHYHKVISISTNALVEECTLNNVTHKRIVQKTNTLIPLWSAYKKLKKEEPNIIVVHSLHFPLQVIYLRLFFGNNIKIFVQHHAEKSFTGLKKRILRIAEKYLTGYFFVSQELAYPFIHPSKENSTKKVFELMEVSSIFYAIDKQEALQFTGIKAARTFLWVGRLNDNKDPLIVVQAFIEFSKTITNAKLYIIHQTTELLQEILALLEANSTAKNNIHLLGKKEHAELLYWYNSADFIVSTSHYEGSGTAVCEAMSCGCIPILTRIDSFKKMTNNESCGLLFEVGNSASLVTAFQKAINMNITFEKQKTLANYKEQLSPDAIAKNMMAAFEQ